MSRIRRLTHILIIIIFLAATAFLYGNFFFRQNRLWNNYRVLLVPDDGKALEMENRLIRQGFGTILSHNTAEVSYSSISNMKTVRLSELPKFLEEGDPRYDPYMREIDKIFFSDGYQIFYIEGNHIPFLMNLKIKKILSGYSGWILPERKSYSYGLIPLGFYILYLFFLLIVGEKRFLIMFLSAVSTVPALIVMNWQILPFCLFINFFCLSTVPLIAGKSLKKPGLSAGTALAFAVIFPAVLTAFQIAKGGNASVILVFVLSQILLSFHERNVKSYSPARKTFEHVIFEPVLISGYSSTVLRKQIRKTSNLARKSGFADFAVIFGLILLFPCAFLQKMNLPDQKETVYIPVIQNSGGSPSLNYENIRNLYFTGDKEFPDISDSIAHLFYQKNFIYNVSYGFPFGKNDITLSTFSNNGGIISRQSSKIVEISDENFSGYTAYIEEEDNIGRLFIRQGTAAPVKTEGISLQNKKNVFDILFYMPLYALFSLVYFFYLKRRFEIYRSFIDYRQEN